MNKRKVFLILAVVFGLIGAFSTYTYVEGVTKTETVYTFKEDTDTAKVLSAQDFEATQLPVSAIPNDAVTDLSMVEGKTLKMPALAGTVLRLPMLVETGESRMSGKLLEQFNDVNVRAIALPFALETTVGGTVKTGDYIDIYGLDPDLKNVVVIARHVEVVRGVPDSIENNTYNDPEMSIVVAFRNNEEVERYAEQMAKGAKILVSLRPLADEDLIEFAESEDLPEDTVTNEELSGAELGQELIEMAEEEPEQERDDKEKNDKNESHENN